MQEMVLAPALKALTGPDSKTHTHTAKAVTYHKQSHYCVHDRPQPWAYESQILRHFWKGGAVLSFALLATRAVGEYRVKYIQPHTKHADNADNADNADTMLTMPTM